MKTLNPNVPTPKLPAGLTERDLRSSAGHSDRDYASDFQVWYVVGIGWVLPTLLISNSRSLNVPARTYAIGLDGKTYRVGRGPHVSHIIYVHARHSRRAALQPFFDLIAKGKLSANTIRDRISSRRAEGQLHRAAGHRSWRWGTL